MKKIIVLFFLPLFAVFCLAAEKNEVRVALVFDDGPVPEDNAPLLAVLKRENLQATFSLVGKTASAHPAAARAIVAAGHEVINHSLNHVHPGTLSDAELDNEVGGGQQAITAAAGKAPRWYWPPFLERGERVQAAAKRAGIAVYELKHLVVSRDYDTSVKADEIFRRATTDVQDGTVILFHEWRKETREQLPAIEAELRRQGCRFMTFSELADALVPDLVAK